MACIDVIMFFNTIIHITVRQKDRNGWDEKERRPPKMTQKIDQIEQERQK